MFWSDWGERLQVRMHTIATPFNEVQFWCMCGIFKTHGCVQSRHRLRRFMTVQIVDCTNRGFYDRTRIVDYIFHHVFITSNILRKFEERGQFVVHCEFCGAL